MTAPETCATCVAFLPIEGQGITGYCRRNPPELVIAPAPQRPVISAQGPQGGMAINAHPRITNAANWCMEHLTPEEYADAKALRCGYDEGEDA